MALSAVTPSMAATPTAVATVKAALERYDQRALVGSRLARRMVERASALELTQTIRKSRR
jgi:hypothetical protein